MCYCRVLLWMIPNLQMADLYQNHLFEGIIFVLPFLSRKVKVVISYICYCPVLEISLWKSKLWMIPNLLMADWGKVWGSKNWSSELESCFTTFSSASWKIAFQVLIICKMCYNLIPRLNLTLQFFPRLLKNYIIGKDYL